MMSVICSTTVRCHGTLDEALHDIRTLGFDSIDLLAIDGWVHLDTRAFVDSWHETVSNLEALLEEHRLNLSAINGGVSQQLWDRTPEANAGRIMETKALVRLMRHFGVSIAGIQPRNDDASRPWECVLPDCVATLREQKAIAEDAGVTLALEFHTDSPFETPEQCRRLLQEVPDMPIVLDPSHFAMHGHDTRILAEFLDNVVHVHIRDASPGRLQVGFGDGTVDFAWLFAELRVRGYAGHYSFEYLDYEGTDMAGEVGRFRDFIQRNG